MKTQTLLAPLRRAIADYKMIENGDKIAVGVSGGKDSIVLLHLLKSLQRFPDINFELLAITIDMGFENCSYQPVVDYCKENDINYIIEKTDIADILFNIRKEKNPCSLCSKMRRGALNTTLNKYGFNKLALGHHLNDVIETFLLSLLFEGRLSTFQPLSYMSRTAVTMIRPMIYIEEKNIMAMAKNLPVVKNPCPADHHTQREVMKDYIKKAKSLYPDIEQRLARAIMNPDRYNLWDNVLEKYEEEKNN